jgi:hypothetical protein
MVARQRWSRNWRHPSAPTVDGHPVGAPAWRSRPAMQRASSFGRSRCRESLQRSSRSSRGGFPPVCREQLTLQVLLCQGAESSFAGRFADRRVVVVVGGVSQKSLTGGNRCLCEEYHRLGKVVPTAGQTPFRLSLTAPRWDEALNERTRRWRVTGAAGTAVNQSSETSEPGYNLRLQRSTRGLWPPCGRCTARRPWGPANPSGRGPSERRGGSRYRGVIRSG